MQKVCQSCDTVVYMKKCSGEIINKLKSVAELILDLIYPPRCFVCGAIFKFGSKDFICETCSQLLETIDFKLLNANTSDCAKEEINPVIEINTASDDIAPDKKYLSQTKHDVFDFIGRCKVCSRPIKIGQLCSQCHDGEFFFDKNYSFYIYDDVVSGLIHKFKYENHPAIGVGFSKLMSSNLELIDFENDIDYIIPVPIHKKRMRTRGFNQSEILCKEISKKMSVPVCNDILKRSKNTKPQWHLNKKERENNLINAFVCVNKKDVAGKNIILFDDIFTTGSTMNKCAEVLKNAGANYVFGITLSITVRN